MLIFYHRVNVKKLIHNLCNSDGKNKEVSAVFHISEYY